MSDGTLLNNEPISDDGLNSEAPPADNNTEAPPAIEFPENWKEGLPEDLRGEQSLGTINTIQDLAKSYINAQKMVGADKIQLPNKYDDGSQLRNVLNKLGLPADLNEYDISPKNVEIPEEHQESFNAFKAHAHKLGLLPQQAQEMFEFLHNQGVEQDQQLIEQQQKIEQEAIANLQKEWGAAFNNKIGLAQQAVKHVAGEDEALLSTLTSPEFGNNPAIVKAFARIGEMLSEDKIINGIPKDDMAKSPAEAQKEIQMIYGDKTHPYNDASHPRHEAAVKEMHELFRLTSV
jgi:hypothetical protein